MSPENPKQNPPLAPALASMTALQAIVALALFAPGVLAPRLGMDAADVSVFAFGCFATGVVGALQGGVLVGTFGAFRIAAGCMAAVVAAMALGMTGTTITLLLAGLCLGLAFGPETPASSAILTRLTRLEQRPLIFSIRQTGNQIGAIFGSLTLPALAAIDPRAGYGLIMALAGMAGLVFFLQSPVYDPLVRRATNGISVRNALDLLASDRRIRRLAIISAPLSAMQLGLNAYLVTYLTGTLSFGHVQAGLFLGIAQAGGLIGRLGWSLFTTRIATRTLVALLALAVGCISACVAALLPGAPLILVGTLCFGFGLTGSGWNGIFLSEVARCAPEGRAGEATGAVLTASYTGLLLAPVVIAMVSAVSGLRLSYLVLSAGCLLAGVWLLRQSDD